VRNALVLLLLRVAGRALVRPLGRDAAHRVDRPDRLGRFGAAPVDRHPGRSVRDGILIRHAITRSSLVRRREQRGDLAGGEQPVELARVAARSAEVVLLRD
jgi:hypothetical protein